MKQISIIFLILILFSCKNSEIQIITLNTDLPEVLPFIEFFNMNNDNINILLSNKNSSDMFIYKGQKENSSIEPKNISYLLKNDIDQNLFYTDIINYVINDDKSIKTLPLSFNVDGVIYNKTNFENNNTVDISSLINNQSIRFSPFWNIDFVIWYYLSNIPNFNIDEYYFDYENFLHTANTMININGNRNAEWDLKSFNEKYLYLSPERLIQESKIDYYFYDFVSYFNINKTFYPDISFTLLSSSSLVFTKDEMVYIGVNQKTKKNRETDYILNWIFNEVNQSNFIKSEINNDSVFALFNNGLSTIKSVTQNSIPENYPELRGLIPKTEVTSLPTTLPTLWESLKNEVFKPTFVDSKTVTEDKWNELYMKYYSEWSKKHNK